MNISSKDLGVITVSPSISPAALLSHVEDHPDFNLRSLCLGPRDPYEIPVVLLQVHELLDFRQATILVEGHIVRRRCLNTLELLTLNMFKKSEIRGEHPVYGRDNMLEYLPYGEETTRHKWAVRSSGFQGSVINPKSWFATTLSTPLDQGFFDTWLDRFMPPEALGT